MKLVKKIHCKKFQSVYFTGCLYFSSCFFVLLHVVMLNTKCIGGRGSILEKLQFV